MGAFAHGKRLNINPSRECGDSNIQNQQALLRKQSFKDEYLELLRRHEIPFEVRELFEADHDGELLSPLRGCLSRRTYETMGENAHGYMLAPLRGEVLLGSRSVGSGSQRSKKLLLFPARC